MSVAPSGRADRDPVMKYESSTDFSLVPSPSPSVGIRRSDSSGSNDGQNGTKWFTWLAPSLKEILKLAHPSPGLIIKNEALLYVEERLEFVLRMLCTDQPSKIVDVENRIRKLFPIPLNQMSIDHARSTLEKGKKKQQFPTVELRSIIQKEYFPADRDLTLTCYVCAVLEVIATDILKLAGKYLLNIRHQEIRAEDVKVSIFADQVLMELFYQDGEDIPVLPTSESSALRKGSLMYADIVKDLIQDEKAYFKELEMIKKVFKANLEKLNPKLPVDARVSSDEMGALFFKIDDLMDTSVNFVNLLEDTMEMDGQSGHLNVGSVFEEMAESEEFEVIEEYASRLLDSLHQWRGAELSLHLTSDEALESILSRTALLQALQIGEEDLLRYVLPKLLLSPLSRLSQYSECCEALRVMGTNVEDNSCDVESLVQAHGIINPMAEKLRTRLNLPQNSLKKRLISQLRSRNKGSRPQILDKAMEIQKLIEGWDGKEIPQFRSDYFYDGSFTKWRQKDDWTERHLFLFDGLLIICKPKPQKKTVSTTEHALKEKFSLTKIAVKRKEDTEEVKNAVELIPYDSPPQILCARNVEEREIWLSFLHFLQSRGLLERQLDEARSLEDKAHPLCLPLPELYPFAEADSGENIVFEEGERSHGIPLIRGATLYKLIERLTYHQYPDPHLVRTFLITYRSFTTPLRLLELLIERFDIPDPVDVGSNQVAGDFDLNASKKRFRKEYCQPVQFRVLNVIRHWIDEHFSDFEADKILLKKLQDFLSCGCESNRRSPSMKKWINSIIKAICRKNSNMDLVREPVFLSGYPDLQWHLKTEEHGYDLMTLHPVEFARQLTLLEYEIYRSVKPAELVDWNSTKNKDNTCPNLGRLIQFSTKISQYVVKYVVSTENYEERVAVLGRWIEVMRECDKLNNFSGVMEINSALQNSPLHRLEKTKAQLSAKMVNCLEQIGKISVAENHGKEYFDRLRSINPPCIPFMGIYLTQLLYTEEGNAAYLNGTDNLPLIERRLINFNKRRKVAEIVSENQQYQNQPYCLQVEPNIRLYLENMDPYDGLDREVVKGDKELVDWMYKQSLKIEPKGCNSPPKFPKRFHFPLKSPSRRPTHLPGRTLSHGPSMSSMSSLVTSPSGHKLPDGDKSGTPSASSSPITPQENVFHATPPRLLTEEESESSADPPDRPPPPPPLPPRRALPHSLSASGSTGECSPRSHQPTSADSQTSASEAFFFPPPSLPKKCLASVRIISGSCSSLSSTAAEESGLLSPGSDSPPPLPPRANSPRSRNGGMTPPPLPQKKKLAVGSVSNLRKQSH